MQHYKNHLIYGFAVLESWTLKTLPDLLTRQSRFNKRTTALQR